MLDLIAEEQPGNFISEITSLISSEVRLKLTEKDGGQKD